MSDSPTSLEKAYPRARFTTGTVRAFIDEFRRRIGQNDVLTEIRRATDGGGTWTLPTTEEFLSLCETASQFRYWANASRTGRPDLGCSLTYVGPDTKAEVTLETRGDVLAVMNILDAVAASVTSPQPEVPKLEIEEPPVSVFIGHGRDLQWRDLKDHLQDQHGCSVTAYEIGARAGHHIRDILADMLRSSSIAFLVMTGEDETADGGLRARQNVVHEVGLFQGRLGFSRAIVLLEEGTEAFSNIDGIQQLRFGKGRIREVFGDVLATLRREFSR